MEHVNPSNAALRDLLTGARRIAVVGLSPKPERDSHRVAAYMQARGYEIIPVYPREEQILGQRVYRRVQDVPGRVDVVNVFRRSDELSEVLDDVLRAPQRPGALWFQFDCIDDDVARRARAEGLEVVMDRCLMVDHRQLIGR